MSRRRLPAGVLARALGGVAVGELPQRVRGIGLAAKKAFLRDYFGKAPGGTDEGWALLTPRYQQEVGRRSYDGFWRTIRSVDAALTYTRQDGSTTTEQHRLALVRSGDGYLIDGDN